MDSYLPGWEAVSSTDASLKSLHGPLVKFLQTVDAFAPATSIAVVGSYMTRTVVALSPFEATALPSADICIAMPTSFCSETDVNMGHYEEKREAFCQMIADYLSSAIEGGTVAVKKSYTRKDKSIVVVSFGNDKCPINIHPRTESVSDSLLKSIKKRARYVNGVLEDASMVATLQLVHRVCAPRPNYVRAIKVLKAWANHSGITAVHGSQLNHSEQFQPCAFGILLALLHESGIVSATMSEENILRTVWVQIARGYLDGAKLMVPESGFPLLNVLSRTSQRFIDTIVKPAAEEALKQNAAVDVFAAPRIIFPMLFSAVFKVACKSSDELLKVDDLVTYALQDRLSYAFVEACSETEAHVFVRIRTADGRNKLSKGPSLEQTAEADKFTQFWGASAVSTRQFADGSIHKCVAWGEQCFATGRGALAGHANHADVMLPVADVTRVIIEGSLRRHLPSLVSLANVTDGITDVLCEHVGEVYIDTAPLAHKTLQSECTNVIKIVAGVQNSLACKVVGFDIISSTARELEPYPIRPHASIADAAPLLSVTPSIEPVYCVLTIDDKNKIPDTLDAINTMKGALCAQLSNALISAGHESYCTTISVDLIMKGGFVFRIYIAHFREVSLLRALERAPQADMLERKLFWSTQHHKYVNSVLTNVHITYSKATRLAKRWVGAMLLSDFIAPEAIELIVGYSYLVPANKPRSAEEGFYRFLQLLARYDWSAPLVLDPTITVDHKKTWDREAMGMIIFATYDSVQKSPFTSHTPRPMIVHRLSSLASGAVRAMESGNFASLWLCDIPSSFDVCLPLAPAMALHADRCIARSLPAPNPFRLWRSGDLAGADRQRYITQLCELEPANFCLRALRGATRDKCMIFMDAYGPQSLAVISLSQHPTPTQIRSLVVALMEAAPKGSLGHIELPPIEAPPAKKKETTEKKEKKNSDNGQGGAESKAPAKDAKKQGSEANAKKNSKTSREAESLKVENGDAPAKKLRVEAASKKADASAVPKAKQTDGKKKGK